MPKTDKPEQTHPSGEPDRQRAQHDDGVFRVVNLRAIANEVGGADDAEGARQAGADDEHDERADNGQHDLGLHHGWLPYRRAAPPRPQGEHGAKAGSEREPDHCRDDFFLEVVHHPGQVNVRQGWRLWRYLLLAEQDYARPDA